MYIKLSTLEFPRYEGDIRLEHPDITVDQTGPSFPCPNTYAPVQYVAAPSVLSTQVAEILPPVQDETGDWKMAWAVRDLTAEEIQARKDFEERMQKEMQYRNSTDSNNPQ
jgi:hypothetical protein